MANWLTLDCVSKKRGIPESTLRYWKSLNYIAFSTIDNVVMLDDESILRFLDIHQSKELSEDCLKKIIREKELERETILAHFDDELFLLKTLKMYQPLFHTLIEELGALIMDDLQREIFLAISGGEPISRVAMRHQITYSQTIKMYSGILERLGENTARIATFRKLAMDQLFSPLDVKDAIDAPVSSVFETHIYAVLMKVQINTVRELLQYAAEHGWDSLKKTRGMGKTSYIRMINTLHSAHFITVSEDGSIEPSPEIAMLLI